MFKDLNLVNVHDPVNSPSHYTSAGNGVECIDAIAAALGRDGFIAFLRGQIMKYTWRLGKKDDILQDARKAAWYQDRLVTVLTEDQPNDAR